MNMSQYTSKCTIPRLIYRRTGPILQEIPHLERKTKWTNTMKRILLKYFIFGHIIMKFHKTKTNSVALSLQANYTGCQLLWIEGCCVVSAVDPLRPLISVLQTRWNSTLLWNPEFITVFTRAYHSVISWMMMDEAHTSKMSENFWENIWCHILQETTFPSHYPDCVKFICSL
jgi:hypothetical protein